MERTSHRSTDGVSAYKRSCPEQAEQLSKALNREQVPTNRVKRELLPIYICCKSLRKPHGNPTTEFALRNYSGTPLRRDAMLKLVKT